MDIRAMMKQAQKMQEQLQKDMEELRVEATSGGGMVTVVTNGAKQLISLKIDPEVVSKDDVEMLQDLILAAVNDAHRKADDQLKKKVGGMMPGSCWSCSISRARGSGRLIAYPRNGRVGPPRGQPHFVLGGQKDVSTRSRLRANRNAPSGPLP